MIIREANISDAAAIARVHVESWRSTYIGTIPDDVLANLSYEVRRQIGHGAMVDKTDRRFIWVAETHEGEIAGFAAARPERSGDYPYEGELYAIYLFQDYQGMGIGRDLAMAIVQGRSSCSNSDTSHLFIHLRLLPTRDAASVGCNG